MKTCEICGFETSNMANHIEVQHSDKKSCEICNAKVIDLHRHNQVAHGPKIRLKCDLCDEVLLKTSMFWHKKSKHSNSKMNCEACGKLLSKSSMFMHQKRYHSNEEWNCDQCDQNFSVKGNLITHKKSQHQAV